MYLDLFDGILSLGIRDARRMSSMNARRMQKTRVGVLHCDGLGQGEAGKSRQRGQAGKVIRRRVPM